MHQTLLVKLKIEDVDKPRLISTFKDYKIAWQFVANWAHENKTTNKNKVHAATYKIVRTLAPGLNSAFVQQARNDALAKLKSIKSNNHKIVCPPQLKNPAIRLDKRTASFKNGILRFASNGGKRISAKTITFPRLEKFLKFKLIDFLFFFKNKEYWSALTFEISELPQSNGPIVGVDMGYRILAATSDGKLIRGTKINKFRRRSRFLKRVLQRKGTKSAKRHLKRLSGKEKRQSRDAIHCAVNEVLRSNASILAVEDLDLRVKKYCKSSNRRRYSVPIAEFQKILQYKAGLCGKRVVKVNPYNTSQDDCRGLGSGKRIGGKYTGVDGKQLHADINAACNIAFRAKTTFELKNPISVIYLNGQAAVNPPIAYKPFHEKSIAN